MPVDLLLLEIANSSWNNVKFLCKGVGVSKAYQLCDETQTAKKKNPYFFISIADALSYLHDAESQVHSVCRETSTQ